MTPNATAIERWLRSDAVDPSGAVWSWRNPAHEGYQYPEAAGLYLSCLGRDDRVARWLQSQVTPDGGVGRGGRGYVFDTAMALNGLLTHREQGGETDASVMRRMFSFLQDGIKRRTPCTPAAGRRWSERWHPHLVKTAVCLHRYGRVYETDASARALAQLAEDFCSGRTALPEYAHAACYAVEGALYLRSIGWPIPDSLLEGAADTLSGAQRAAGHLPAFVKEGPPRADATAQAVRIWSCIDATKYDTSIRSALTWLGSMQHLSGGIVYEAGSEDVNTWASLFTLQAVRWSDGAQDLCKLA